MNNLSRYSDPLEVWQQAACCAPGNPRARQALGGAYTARGRYDEAEREFRAAASAGEASYAASGATSLAMLYAETGRVKKAARLYHALGTRYLSATQYRSLAETLLLQGRQAAAVFWFKKALDVEPRDSFSRFKLACAYALLKKRHAAEIQWQALTRDPTLDASFSSISLANLGLLYLEEKRLPLAQEAFERSLAANPNQLGATTNLAELYAKAGRRADGLALYDKLIERLKRDQHVAFASAGELSGSELRQTAGSLPAALALRARFLAKHPAPAVAKA